MLDLFGSPAPPGRARVIHGDCLVEMAKLEVESVDAIVTDPPYHLTSGNISMDFGALGPNGAKDPYGRIGKEGATNTSGRGHKTGFMGKEWDGGDVAFRPETWRAVMRVLKPGGHLLAFGGSRTFHRVACAIEDAGFELRDTIMWVYGSGFPKSLDMSKAIDKLRRRDYVLVAIELGLSVPGNNLHDWTIAGHSPSDEWWEKFKSVLTPAQWGAIERRVVGQKKVIPGVAFSSIGPTKVDVTDPATDAARQWAGWGTSLKPSYEPVCVARKPLSEPTVAANVLRHGVGAINIDACRVESEPVAAHYGGGNRTILGQSLDGYTSGDAGKIMNTAGRWPANLLHDNSDEVLTCFPETGAAKSGGRSTGRNFGPGGDVTLKDRERIGHDDAGGSAARFFKACEFSDDECAALVASNSEVGVADSAPKRLMYAPKASRAERAGSKHPTVKPLALMRWLVRLVTPSGGVVLDPFAGSGTTLAAALAEDFRCVGIEREAEYVEDIRRRIGEHL